MTAQSTLLACGRLHLNHGPIDLVCQAWGTPEAIRTAYQAAAAVFPTILPALCAELPHLRTPLPSSMPRHPIARAMHQAVALPHVVAVPGLDPGIVPTTHAVVQGRRSTVKHDMFPSPSRSHPLHGVTGQDKPGQDDALFKRAFITPMAAVAGAVADHVLSHMTAATTLEKAYVNNGGDIAFHLTPAHTLTCALVTTVANPAVDGAFRLHHESPARGIATSGQACKGRGGKSFSFGIADSVTILARTAAMADAAATLVANAIDLPGHPGIERRPADAIDPDSDLGPRLITWSVPRLSAAEIERSLDKGRQTRRPPHPRRAHRRRRPRPPGPVRHLPPRPPQFNRGIGRMTRKILTILEETHEETGREIKPITRKAAAIAIVKNPYAGMYQQDLEVLVDLGERLGWMLGKRAIALLGIPPDQVQSYGKAALVGEDGELEHAAAILHPKLGAPLRAAIGKGAALIPSAAKRGPMGATLDVPLGHKDAAWVRSHFDAMTVSVPDAPRRDEILVAIVLTDSGRPLPRIGGLEVKDIQGTDGLR